MYLRRNTKAIDLERRGGRKNLRGIEGENHNQNILDETIFVLRKKIKFISYLFSLKDHIHRPMFMKQHVKLLFDFILSCASHIFII